MAEFEKYEKKRLLGTNQYGAVHEAFDFGLSRSVAILEFHPRFRQDPETWREIWREVTERSQIEHDNVLSPLTSVESEGQVILPFMSDNFGRRLAQSPVPYDSVRTAVKCALRGLSCLHKRGKIHGYITPANLLYGSEDRAQSVKISFSPGLFLGGIVPIKGRDQKSLAPEMFNEQLFGKAEHSVDLYCLGFAAYEMLRGKAFAELIPGTEINKNAYEAFHASPDMGLPALSTIDSKTPPDLVRVIERLLRKRVADRYATADEALKDLDLGVQDSYEPVALVSPPVESNRKTVVAVHNEPEKLRNSAPVKAATETKNAANPPKVTPKKVIAGPTPQNQMLAKWTETAKGIWDKHWVIVTAAAGMLTVFAVLSLASLFTSEPDVTVSIVSDPAGATVTVGQTKLKEKTSTKATLKLGTVELAWEMPGYKSGKGKFEIKPPVSDAWKKPSENLQVIRLTLTALPITVPLTVSPKTATVKVKGEVQPANKSGKYELSLLPGTYDLVVELADYETHTVTFDPTAQKKLDIKLVRKPKDPDQVTDSGKPPVVTPPIAKLPAGLVAIDGSAVHPTLGLPLKVEATVLKEHLQAGEYPLEMVLVDSGEFVFGATDPLEGELPQSKNNISTAYYIGTTETTAAQFAAWRKIAQKQPKADADQPVDAGKEKPTDDAAKADIPSADLTAANRPAVMVSFTDAQEFCLWISPAVGRLPTEEEWERVGRGTDGRMYPWGNEAPTAEKCRLAFDRDSATDDNPSGPVGVRDLPSGATIVSPSGADVYHLLGNVAEWCEDLYLPGANESESTPGAAKNHVIRGASYLEPVSERTRLTCRANVDAKGAPDVGFRVLVPVPKQVPKPTEEKAGKSPAKKESKPTETESKK